MEKFCVRPRLSAYILKMRTHMEWMVLTHMRRVSAMRESRSFISLAALLVKVMARIFSGGTPRSSTRWAMRAVKTRVLPLPAPASTSTAPSVVSTGSRCSSLSFISFMKNIIPYPPKFDKHLPRAERPVRRPFRSILPRSAAGCPHAAFSPAAFCARTAPPA